MTRVEKLTMAENKGADPGARREDFVDPMRGEGELREISDDDRSSKETGVLSAFFYYCNLERPNIRAKFPQWSTVDVGKELGRRWSGMDDETRQEYVDMMSNERRAYERVSVFKFRDDNEYPIT